MKTTWMVLVVGVVAATYSDSLLAQQACWVCEFETTPPRTYCRDTAIMGRVDCEMNMSQTWCSVEGYPECTYGLLALPSGQVVARNSSMSPIVSTATFLDNWSGTLVTTTATTQPDAAWPLGGRGTGFAVTRSRCGMILTRATPALAAMKADMGPVLVL